MKAIINLFVRGVLFSCLGFFLPSLSWSSDALSVRLLSERHRTEWNWVEYRISLTNESSVPILNPEIRYFAENSLIQYCENRENDVNCTATRYGDYAKDSLLTATVDNSTWLSTVTPSVHSNWKYTVITLNVSGLLYPGRTIEINFRVYKKDWTLWDSHGDWSYQKNAEVIEPNYFMVVYDASRNLLWGDDPTSGKRNADVVTWSDRGGNSVIDSFDGDTSAMVPAGRFWMLKDIPLSAKERGLLTDMGIHKLEAGRFQGKSVLLFKADSTVRKSVLDTLIAGFYNAFAVDDTTQLKVNFIPEDLVKEDVICDANNHCQKRISVRTEFDMQTRCWPDVSMPACKNIVQQCGGVNASIDRSLVLSTHRTSSLPCLKTSKDIRHIEVQRQGEPTNDIGRKAVNIDVLQNSEAWKRALQATQPTPDWLSDADYTGEGIIVGVYDNGIYYDHAGFNEVSDGVMVPRQSGGWLGHSYGDFFSHGTHVAGIIGGNGWNPDESGNEKDSFKYRGIAPKVKFYANQRYLTNQVGHVANHSHITRESSTCANCYGTANRSFDNAIFKDWKETSDKGDNLSKLEVVAAANNGFSANNGVEQIGYHSILVNSKNPITVGNYASYTGKKNISSSMGPTWDGRLKPDVMAPGSAVQYSFDDGNPLVLYIDYVKLYHKGETSPYFVHDFSSDIQPSVESYFSSLSIVSDADAEDGQALKWGDARADAGESYANWKTSDFSLPSLDVEQGDVIEFRIKHVSGNLARPSMSGSVYFCPSTGGFYDNGGLMHKHINFIWDLSDIDGNVSDGYVVNRFEWTENSMTTYFFRFGFGYEVGITSSVPCDKNDGGTCYGEGSGTSMAAPYVSGIAALMYQRYQKMTGDPLDEKSMRNSTAKAILIHTAEDMEDAEGFGRARAQDVYYADQSRNALGQRNEHLVKYGKGPDFATGWGKVNGKAALEVIDNYSKGSGEFSRFREFEIRNGKEKRWKVQVPSNRDRLRLTLVWDDAPPSDENISAEKYLESKLVNDLDMYLISPSGKYFFPWRLEPLPTDNIDINGNLKDDMSRISGLENIKESDIQGAERYCGKNDQLYNECFDHLNNVEVVDVDNPEKGTWQVAVRGTHVEAGNSADGDAQVASIVSDFALGESGCQIAHPYAPLDNLVCEYNLGDNLENFVTFDPLTFAGSGDYIYLYDAADYLLGTYTGSDLAGKRIKVKSKKLKVILDSDNDAVQGWGFGVKRIENTPYSILPMLFKATQKVKTEE